MLRQAEQIAAASALPPEERFSLMETDSGYAIWDDQPKPFMWTTRAVSEEFTSEWQAQAYLEEVKKAVSEKQTAEWLAVERAKLPPLEYAAGDHFVIFSEDGKGSSEFVLTRIEENEVWYTFPDLPQQAPVSMRREEFESNLRSGHIWEQTESRDYSNDYRLLDRLRADCPITIWTLADGQKNTFGREALKSRSLKCGSCMLRFLKNRNGFRSRILTAMNSK